MLGVTEGKGEGEGEGTERVRGRAREREREVFRDVLFNTALQNFFGFLGPFTYSDICKDRAPFRIIPKTHVFRKVYYL